MAENWVLLIHNWIEYEKATRTKNMAKISLSNKIKNRIKNQVFCCYMCGPWGNDEDVFDRIDLYDFLSDLEEDNNKLEKAIKGSCCPNCGNSFESIIDEVVLNEGPDLKTQEIFKKINKPKVLASLNKFYEHLSNYPYLGLDDPDGIGKKILKGLKKINEIKISNEIWYRARSINEEGRLFKGEEIWAPNPITHKVSEGRYNHSGKSYLYLAENEITAFNEISKPKQEFCVIQKFKLTNIEKILDLRSKDYISGNIDADIYTLAIIHTGQLTKKASDSGSWKPHYLIPRFVADSARFLGFNGIKFTSVFDSGDNLILFNPLKTEVLFEGNSYLFEKPKYEFGPDELTDSQKQEFLEI